MCVALPSSPRGVGLTSPPAHRPPQVVIDESLGFAKDRTISRLIEMQSDEYREQHARQRAPHLLQALLEAKRAG